jgi:hypothetical protein
MNIITLDDLILPPAQLPMEVTYVGSRIATAVASASETVGSMGFRCGSVCRLGAD